jgi:hypothetical protein
MQADEKYGWPYRRNAKNDVWRAIEWINNLPDDPEPASQSQGKGKRK